MPVQPAPAVAPMSEAQIQALGSAQRRAKSLRRAAGVAAFGGWTAGVFGAITVAGSLIGGSPDRPALLLGLALGAAAFNEFRGGAMVRRLDDRGPRLLGFNQLGLGLALVLYAAWRLREALAPSAGAGSLATGDPQADAMIAGLSRSISIGLYGGLAALGVIVPGLTAVYYFSRGATLRAFLQATPPWAAAAVRAGMA